MRSPSRQPTNLSLLKESMKRKPMNMGKLLRISIWSSNDEYGENSHWHCFHFAFSFISRQFTRKYTLPRKFPFHHKLEQIQEKLSITIFCQLVRFIYTANSNPNDVQSTLSSDGVLTITASRKPIQDAERVVPITQTGTAAAPASAVSPPPVAAASPASSDSAAAKVE